jgi:hypothetical protein
MSDFCLRSSADMLALAALAAASCSSSVHSRHLFAKPGLSGRSSNSSPHVAHVLMGNGITRFILPGDGGRCFMHVGGQNVPDGLHPTLNARTCAVLVIQGGIRLASFVPASLLVMRVHYVFAMERFRCCR